MKKRTGEHRIEISPDTKQDISTPSLRDFLEDPIGWAIAGAVLGINMLVTWVNQQPVPPKKH